MRIIFAGTPDFAVPSLQALIQSAHDVVAVYTQPDRRRGRGRQVSPSPVKSAALAAGIPVYQPESLSAEDQVAEMSALKPDYLVVAAYGLLLPCSILAIPRCRPINVHASLLPRWRGASPIQQAIRAGDSETGVTIMEMVKALDAGDYFLSRSCPIDNTDTAQTLHDTLAELGAQALMTYLSDPDSYPPIPQVASDVTYAPKIKKSDAQLDWSLSAKALDCQIRAFQPWPGAELQWGSETWRVWAAQAVPASHPTGQPGTVLGVSAEGIDVETGQGALRITRWQRPGGKPVSIADFLNGNPPPLLVGEQVFG